MPIVHIHLLDGRTVEQKRALVEKVTAAIVDTVNTKPEAVKIILHDMATHDYATAGILYQDQKK